MYLYSCKQTQVEDKRRFMMRTFLSRLLLCLGYLPPFLPACLRSLPPRQDQNRCQADRFAELEARLREQQSMSKPEWSDEGKAHPRFPPVVSLDAHVAPLFSCILSSFFRLPSRSRNLRSLCLPQWCFWSMSGNFESSTSRQRRTAFSLFGARFLRRDNC
jgi:hypothetical protein